MFENAITFTDFAVEKTTLNNGSTRDSYPFAEAAVGDSTLRLTLWPDPENDDRIVAFINNLAPGETKANNNNRIMKINLDKATHSGFTPVPKEPDKAILVSMKAGVYTIVKGPKPQTKPEIKKVDITTYFQS